MLPFLEQPSILLSALFGKTLKIQSPVIKMGVATMASRQKDKHKYTKKEAVK